MLAFFQFVLIRFVVVRGSVTQNVPFCSIIDDISSVLLLVTDVYLCKIFQLFEIHRWTKRDVSVK